MNVRYALEGSVQRCDNRLRVNVQLIDATTGNHLWADRFDKPFADLLDMQDEIVARIARTLDNQLIVAKARRAARTLNPDAMDLYFQGRHSCNRGVTLENLTEARNSFERALATDPQNVDAMSWRALVETVLVAAFLKDNGPPYLAAAETMVLKALRLAPDHAWAHFTLAMVLIYTNRTAQGVAECERALALDRNLADAHEMMGQAKFYMGCGAGTEFHVNEALRLSPRDISAFRWMNTAGFAKLQISAGAEAAAWCARGRGGLCCVRELVSSCTPYCYRPRIDSWGLHLAPITLVCIPRTSWPWLAQTPLYPGQALWHAHPSKISLSMECSAS
ncbi:hypothetical protein ABIF86_008408 [Bradyrhizobium japonicum]